MIRHSLIVAALVAILVAAQVYLISPGEVRIAYAGAKHKLTAEAAQALRQPPPLWFFPLTGAVLWWGRRARKRRFRLAAEQKMAVTLSRAVRQMSGGIGPGACSQR